MKVKFLSGHPLKTVCVLGLILALLASWGMVIFALILGSPGKGTINESSFIRNLREYDLINAPKLVLEGENPAQIERRLSLLQDQVKRPDEQLSVLKRRRALAMLDRRYISSYEKAAREAAERFAFSAPIAATAAEAAVLEDTPESLALLKTYASRITQNRLDLLNLGIYILSGDLNNPARAAPLPALQELLSLDLSFLPDQRIRTELLVDDFLLKAYRKEIPAAAAKLSVLLGDALTDASDFRRMAADFYYDHNNPLRAAELFISLGAEADLARAADAFFLAGEIPGARNIWLALSSPAESPRQDEPTRLRSLYNLAASSVSGEEQVSWLEKLFSLRSGNSSRSDSEDNTGIFSIIRYSRLLDSERSIAILEEVEGNALQDLELHRRRIDSWPPTRAAAETWLLLNKYSNNEDLYEWAAWYFERQKLDNEAERLFKDAIRLGMNGSWLGLQQALVMLKEGRIADGEKILLEALQPPGEEAPDWRIPANLGRIQESRRAIAAALDYYQTAAALIAEQRQPDRLSAAQLQMRISRCLDALGSTAESRRALEYAYELDPENINIRQAYRAVQR